MVTKTWNKGELYICGMNIENGIIYKGTSADDKPTGPDVQNGAPFWEIDTSKIYAYDAENSVWYEQ